MKNNNQRNIKIVSELMNFCYSHGGNDIKLNINTENNETLICIEAFVPNISADDLHISRKLLNAPRCHEIEEYYWTLTGNDTKDTELTLVGMMTDEASITYENNILEIKVIRKH